MGVLINLATRTIGYWRVLGRVAGKSPHTYYFCRCVCGKEKKVNSLHLRSGRSTSCGCKKSDSISKKMKKNNYPSAFNALVARYKNCAKRRNISWELSNEEAFVLFNSTCFYCGCPPSSVNAPKRLKSTFMYNGIDRVDNNKGYVAGNTVACCKADNRAKDTLTHEAYVEHIKEVYENLYGR